MSAAQGDARVNELYIGRLSVTGRTPLWCVLAQAEAVYVLSQLRIPTPRTSRTLQGVTESLVFSLLLILFFPNEM